MIHGLLKVPLMNIHCILNFENEGKKKLNFVEIHEQIALHLIQNGEWKWQLIKKRDFCILYFLIFEIIFFKKFQKKKKSQKKSNQQF